MGEAFDRVLGGLNGGARWGWEADSEVVMRRERSGRRSRERGRRAAGQKAMVARRRWRR